MTPADRAYVFAALLAIPSPLDIRIGSTLTQPGKYSRFTTYLYLPNAYLQHVRPHRDHRHHTLQLTRKIG